jgi:hypothetical protein
LKETYVTVVPDVTAVVLLTGTVKEIEAGLLSCVEPKRQTICLMARAVETDSSSSNRKVSNANANPVNIPTKGNSKNERDSHLPAEYTETVGNPSADKLRAAIVDTYR